MNIFLNLLLISVGFLSFVPVIQLFRTSRNLKYRCLKFLVNATFTWTILIFIERFVSDVNVVYYAHMLGYPLKFLMSAFMLCTIYNYVERKLKKWQIGILGVLFAGEYLLAITNVQTRYILNLIPSEMLSYETLYQVDNGPFFIYHLVLTYLVLLIAIVYLVVFLRQHKDVRHYKSVSRTMIYSVIIVLSFNAIQILALKSTVDLTYVSLVIVTYALYRVIYHKDMIFNLKTSGRGEILSNMREMYIITDYDKRVVEVSDLLKNKYKVNVEDFEGKKIEQLLETLSESIVFYEEYDVDQDVNPEKDHFHLREKKFTLKGMNEYGYMMLMYDETQVFKLLRELNKLSNYDNMTGLHNRNYIENKLQSYQSTNEIGIISLDLNGLKANNDYLGHERGDFLLRTLAIKMKEVMMNYPNKEMARIGGDEFLIVVEKTTKEELSTIRKQILDLCKSENIVDKISVSIGIAFSNDSSDNVYTLIQEADKDMYSMKQKTSKEYSIEIVKYATNKDTYIR